MKHKYLVVILIVLVPLPFTANKGVAQNANPLIHSVSPPNATLSHKSIDIKGAIEDTSKRTLYSSTWRTRDGKIMAHYSSAIINYPDAKGHLQPIDLTLNSDAKGWVADKQPSPCYFHSDRSTAISLGGNKEFVFNKNCSVNGMALDQQIKSLRKGEVELDLSNGIHKELTFVPSGIKTNYIFDKPLEGGITVTEEVEFPEGCIFQKDEKRGKIQDNGWAGEYVLLSPDGKQVLLRFQPAECYDAKKHWCLASYSLQKKDGKNVLVTTVPSGWLSSAVYPVTIDPLVVGITSYWTGGSTPSCLYPNFYKDSILVTIPGKITITFFTIDYAYRSNPSVSNYIPINDGIFYLSTPCAKTDTLSCADSPGGGDTAGICYLVPNFDFHNPMTCCYNPSCLPQSFWLSAHLARRKGGATCKDTNYIWYTPNYYTGFQYNFSAWLEGYTDSVSSLAYTPTSQCSNSCNLTMSMTAEFGVPPYTVSHPWAAKDTVIGNYSGCVSDGTVKMKLKIPGCPFTCGTNDTITVPPPVVVDACGDTVKNIPIKKVVLKPVPVITSTPDTMIVCSGTPITLSLNSCVAGTTINWTGSDKTSGSGNSISDNTSDTGKNPITVIYKITGSANGCNSDTVKALGIINPTPVINITGSDTLTQGRSETLTATGGVAYLWSPSTGVGCVTCPNPVMTPTVTTTYTVEVTDSDGCQKTSSFTIQVLDEAIIIPNVITPNGDGKNDLFTIQNLQFYANSKLTIFDRWGNQVYSTSNYLNNWNGGGQSDGVYYYVLTLATGKEYHGFLQIIK